MNARVRTEPEGRRSRRWRETFAARIDRASPPAVVLDVAWRDLLETVAEPNVLRGVD